MAAELSSESVRLARASWDAADAGHRLWLLLRSRSVVRQVLESKDMNLALSFWEELPPEVCEAVAWDVQTMRVVLGAGAKALRGAMAIVEGQAA